MSTEQSLDSTCHLNQQKGKRMRFWGGLWVKSLVPVDGTPLGLCTNGSLTSETLFAWPPAVLGNAYLVFPSPWNFSRLIHPPMGPRVPPGPPSGRRGNSWEPSEVLLVSHFSLFSFLSCFSPLFSRFSSTAKRRRKEEGRHKRDEI